MMLHPVGYSLKYSGGAGLWILSIFMAIILHGAGGYYFRGSSIGASAPGIGGIDIGLGSSGRLAGQRNEAGEGQVTSMAAQGDSKPQQESSSARKETAEQKTEAVEQNSSSSREKPPLWIEKEDKPEGEIMNDMAVKIENTNYQTEETGTGPSSQRQLEEGGEGGLSGYGGQDQTGIGNGSTGGGPTGDMASYYITLQQWIQRHQKYPSKAYRLKQQGVTMVKLGITAQGKLLFARIVKSSGFPLLDEAALEAIHKSAPLVPIPAHLGKKMMTLVIPMQFILT